MSRHLFALGVVLVLSTPALMAQSPTAVTQGIFGAARQDTRQHLNLLFDLAEAVDSIPPPEAQNLVPQGVRQSGGYSTILVGTGDFQRQTRRYEASATAMSAFRYYDRLGHAFPVSHSAGAGLKLSLPARTSLSLNQQAAFAPSFMYQLFPAVALPELGDAIQPAPDFRVDRARSFTYLSQVMLEAGSARGHKATVTGTFNRTEFQRGTQTRPETAVLGGRAAWSHGVGRASRFTTEYEYREGEFGYGGRATDQRLRIGGEYSRALSGTRRAIFRINVTPAMQYIPGSAFIAAARARLEAAKAAAAIPDSEESAANPDLTPALPDTAVYVPDTVYRLEGDVSGEYRFRRTWFVNGTYSRRSEYIALFRTPVFGDTAQLSFGGLVSRRMDVSAAAAYAAGHSALQRSPGADPRLETRLGSLRVRYAVARSLAIYSEYIYYFYDLKGQNFLAPDIPQRLQLHGGRVGLTFWIPALGG